MCVLKQLTLIFLLIELGQGNEETISEELNADDILTKWFHLLSVKNMGEKNEEKSEEDISKIQKMPERKSNSNPVHLALSTILGENPSDEQKLTIEQLDAILQLDELLQEQERKDAAMVDKRPDHSFETKMNELLSIISNGKLLNTSETFENRITVEDEATKKEEAYLVEKSPDPTFEANMNKILSILSDGKFQNASEKMKNINENEVEAKKDYGAVREALSVILGEKPSEEEKLTIKEIEAVIKLDTFLQEDEEKTKKSKEKVSNLVNTAVDFVEGAVNLRENAEKILIGNDFNADYESYTYEDILEYLDMSPSELRELIYK